MFYLGIDPGVSGGLAILSAGGAVISAVRMPETEKDLLKALDPGVEHGICGHAVIERVSAFPQMGVVSAFTFGRGFGGLIMAVTALNYPFDLVVPRVWQPAMGVVYPKRGDGSRDKNVTKQRAQQLFPRATVTHAVADALLLAEYVRRQHVGRGSDHNGKGKEGGKAEAGKGRK